MEKEIKSFVKTNKKTMIFVGKVILGVVVTVVVLGLSKKIMAVRNNETLTDNHTEDGWTHIHTADFSTPEEANPLRAHYNDENVLYANGLPVFANDEQTTVYRDAIDDKAIDDWLDMGGKIIERV